MVVQIENKGFGRYDFYAMEDVFLWFDVSGSRQGGSFNTNSYVYVFCGSVFDPPLCPRLACTLRAGCNVGSLYTKHMLLPLGLAHLGSLSTLKFDNQIEIMSI